MPDLEFALVDGDNFDDIPDPQLPGASCLGCDYWERIDGGRQGPANAPRRSAKLRRLTAASGVAGSYGMLAHRTRGEERVAIGYAQFGPISAYPRAQAIRDRYPDLPDSPPPYVVTCLQVRGEAGVEREDVAERLLRAVCAELDRRGIVAVEAFPEVVADAWVPSSGPPRVYAAAGFVRAAGDDRYPVFRIELAGEAGDAAWPADLLRAPDDSDDWPLPLPRTRTDDDWPMPPKPSIRNPFGED